MARTSVILLMLLCLTGLPLPATADGVAVTPAAVDDAITRGTTYLLEKQRSDGSFGTGSHGLGQTALAAYALMHAGLREDQLGKPAKRLRRTLAYLDKHGPGRGRRAEKDPGTYTTALLVLLLRERGRQVDRERMQRLVDLLVRTQAKNGQWWYFGRPGKTGKAGPDTGDNSNTQFAVLALAVAHADGLEVPRSTLERARTWWRTSIKQDDGWGYASGGSPKSATTGSMTGAAVACLGALNSVLDGTPRPNATDPAQPSPVTRGLTWLEAHFSVTKNEGPTPGKARQRQKDSGRGWLHYYLWTLERAFVLTETERLGSHDWYREGAAQLLGTQKKDGSWRGEHPLYATSFALLFLTRAADPPRALTNPRSSPKAQPDPVVTGPGNPPAEDGPPPAAGDGQPAAPAKPAGTLEDWLEENLPPGELAKRCRLSGASTLRALTSFLQDPSKEVRQRAWEALSELLDEAHTFRADRHPMARARLQSWLRKYEHILVLDGDRFRIP